MKISWGFFKSRKFLFSSSEYRGKFEKKNVSYTEYEYKSTLIFNSKSLSFKNNLSLPVAYIYSQERIISVIVRLTSDIVSHLA